MWRPGFPVAECWPARLRGLHRDLCVVSHVHRGTPDNPGLVAGLDRGGSCRGIALRVKPGHETDTLAYLREREHPTMGYRETVRPVELVPGCSVPAWATDLAAPEDPAMATAANDVGPAPSTVTAVCYVADRTHHQYAKDLTLQTKAAYVCSGIGISGHARDYLDELIVSLETLGIHDAGLIRLQGAVQAHTSGRSEQDPLRLKQPGSA